MGISPKVEINTVTLTLSQPLRKIWNIVDNKILPNTIASDNERGLFVSTLGGKIILVNTNSGKKQWESDLGGEIVSGPYLENENLYIITQPVYNTDPADIIKKSIDPNYLTIRSLNKDTGLTNWQTKIPIFRSVDDVDKEFLFIYQSNLITLDNKGNIASLNKADGQINWSKKLNITFSTIPFFSDDKVIFGTSAGEILFISLQNGNTFKTINTTDSPITLYYSNKKNNLIWGDRKGFVLSTIVDSEKAYKSNSRKKLIWKFRNGAEISDISLTPQGFLVSSYDNFVYLISEDKGNLIWKKRLAGRVSAKPLILGDYAIIITVAEPVASILELESGKFVNKITLADENFFIDRPLNVGNKLVLTTQQGIFAFSNDSSNIRQ